MARNSAQPMLWPFDFQFFCSFHESQTRLKTTPIPQLVEASTQNSILEGGGGGAKDELQNDCDRHTCHQAMSFSMLSFGVCQAKGDDAHENEEAKRDKASKHEWPLGTAKEQWTKVLRMDSASC